jgi:hypothetical protein
MRVIAINMVLLLNSVNCVTLSAQNVVTAIAVEKMNVVYVGLDNPLTVLCSQRYDSISTDNGIIRKDGFDSVVYNFKPERAGTATLILWSGRDTLASKVMRAKLVPQPDISIAGVPERDGKIELTKGELVNASGINAIVPGFDYDAKWIVTGFTITLMRNGVVQEIRCSGSTFTQEMKQLMQTMNPGEFLWVDNIRATGPDGTTRVLPSVKVLMK